MDIQNCKYYETMTDIESAITFNKEIMIYKPFVTQLTQLTQLTHLIKYFVSYEDLVCELVLRSITIVGLCGPKESGKDTSALLLKDKSDGTLAFAKKLKEICMKVFDLTYEHVYDTVLKEQDLERPIIVTKDHIIKITYYCVKYGRSNIVDLDLDHKFEGHVLWSPRNVMQFIGTDVIRNHVDPLWNINAFLTNNTINSLKVDGVYFVTDIRFPNEYLYLKNLKVKKFYAFYIHRDRAEKMLKRTKHESEKQVIEVRKLLTEENVIYNNGTLEDLTKELHKRIKLD